MRSCFYCTLTGYSTVERLTIDISEACDIGIRIDQAKMFPGNSFRRVPILNSALNLPYEVDDARFRCNLAWLDAELFDQKNAQRIPDIAWIHDQARETCGSRANSATRVES